MPNDPNRTQREQNLQAIAAMTVQELTENATVRIDDQAISFALETWWLIQARKIAEDRFRPILSSIAYDAADKVARQFHYQVNGSSVLASVDRSVDTQAKLLATQVVNHINEQVIAAAMRARDSGSTVAVELAEWNKVLDRYAQTFAVTNTTRMMTQAELSVTQVIEQEDADNNAALISGAALLLISAADDADQEDDDEIDELNEAEKRRVALQTESIDSTTARTEAEETFGDVIRSGWNRVVRTIKKIWFTEDDDTVCPICFPRHGTGPEEWDGDDGPPAHPNCRCWLEYEIED